LREDRLAARALRDKPLSLTETEKSYMQFLYILFGAMLGFVFALVGTYVQRIVDHKERQKRAKTLFSLVIREAREGVNRCESIVTLYAEKKISSSRVYVAVWDSARVELTEYAHDLKVQDDILGRLHNIYYRFDLVNFNMQLKQYSVGVAFAVQYLKQIKMNLQLVEEAFGKLGITLPAA